MALDEDGMVWVALVSGGIARLTPQGDVDRRLEPPSAFTTSVCFAGRHLYVTTGGHSEHPELGGCVLRTTVDVAGALVAPARRPQARLPFQSGRAVPCLSHGDPQGGTAPAFWLGQLACKEERALRGPWSAANW